MPALVLDASVVIAATLPDENDNEAASAVIELAEADGAAVPAIWPTEVANALLVASRRGRLALSDVRDALERLEGLAPDIASPPWSGGWRGPLALAHRHRLTVYDAAYLDLALTRGLPLATLDAALRGAAEAEGLTVLPPRR